MLGKEGRGGLPTSSSLKAIMETARKTASVEPVMVVMRSGHEPSEMVMRALLWGRWHAPSGLFLSPCPPGSPHPTTPCVPGGEIGVPECREAPGRSNPQPPRTPLPALVSS